MNLTPTLSLMLPRTPTLSLSLNMAFRSDDFSSGLGRQIAT